jgi:hypothetical protein
MSKKPIQYTPLSDGEERVVGRIKASTNCEFTVTIAKVYGLFEVRIGDDRTHSTVYEYPCEGCAHVLANMLVLGDIFFCPKHQKEDGENRKIEVSIGLLELLLDYLYDLRGCWSWKKGYPRYEKELNDLSAMIQKLSELISGSQEVLQTIRQNAPD